MRACHAAWQALASRLQREGFRARVTRVLQAWADWAVYPTDFLLHINDVFLGQEKEIAASAGAAGEAAASPARSSSSEEWEGGGGAGPLDGAALRRLAAGRRLPAAPAPRPADPDIDGVPVGGFVVASATDCLGFYLAPLSRPRRGTSPPGESTLVEAQ
ncbi:U2 snRNP-associated SURP motif-containing protein-like [Ostrinia furnacalis]|uniref:U2 snRNP-associated SURP motif-containing protein-like n=1 Tax=Ostrinia furnacalis TaxID=93504 RepID=UPI0010394E24|nr:U2 snRNP-associated SURP motif-containing protein-like [Ostrinia furnacalis]